MDMATIYRSSPRFLERCIRRSRTPHMPLAASSDCRALLITTCSAKHNTHPCAYNFDTFRKASTDTGSSPCTDTPAAVQPGNSSTLRSLQSCIHSSNQHHDTTENLTTSKMTTCFTASSASHPSSAHAAAGWVAGPSHSCCQSTQAPAIQSNH
jgi:hypothetical protein